MRLRGRRPGSCTLESTKADKITARYRRFAAEAHGRSPLYEQLSLEIAQDGEVLELLAPLPWEKTQPNLLFAAIRHLFGTPADWDDFRRKLIAHFPDVQSLILRRSTQTNEPARCATLLPILARLPQPLALIEVGASAGLCLLPHLYGYDYGGGRQLRPPDAPSAPPVFSCAADARTPLPDRLPEVAWSAGLDLNPIDLSDAEQVAWLEALVWPEQTGRLTHLRSAIKVAATARPRLVQGDLRTDLARLAGEAPGGATRVIFHTAVLVYLTSRQEREAFAAEAQSLCDYWIANEAPDVFPDIAARAGPPPSPGHFLLSVNGTPTAWTDPHGASIDWITEPPG